MLSLSKARGLTDVYTSVAFNGPASTRDALLEAVELLAEARNLFEQTYRGGPYYMTTLHAAVNDWLAKIED